MTMPTKPDPEWSTERDLARYVHAVAAEIGVPVEATNYDFSDTIDAYLALGKRCRRHPDRDLMLIWTQTDGWSIAVETAPAERPLVLSTLACHPAPEPERVAAFVTDTLNSTD